jgi:hypothetical protein
MLDLRERIAELEAELAEARKDTARINRIESLAEEYKGGLLIHHQLGDVKWSGVGLGLSPRNLRKAVDDTMETLYEQK